MTHTPPDPTTLAHDLEADWLRFIDTFEPWRPALYRFCRSLTRTPWDAEDLMQDALMRAFATIGGMSPLPANPRAWLFRVASNLWIDRQRKKRELLPGELPDAPISDPPAGARDAGARLLAALPPQERVAVLLKDVFDFRANEIAEVLGTTTGAIKTALHRGRGRLAESNTVDESEANVPGGLAASASPRTAEEEGRPVIPEVLDAFCEAFNARDLARMTELLLENGSAEISGMVPEYGRDAIVDRETGSLFHTVFSPLAHAVPDALLVGNRDAPKGEMRLIHGEPTMLIWYDHDEGPVVRDLVRFRVAEGGLAHIHYHFVSPEILEEVCAELGVPWRTNGYRYFVD